MKEHNHFDDLIKGKVDNFSVPLADNAWEIFDQKQQAFLEEASSLEDTLLDNKAAQLNSFEVPLNKSHWALMAERIQKELIFIRELSHLKAMELSLMALMLLFFFQQFPIQKNTPLGTTPTPIAAALEDLIEEKTQPISVDKEKTPPVTRTTVSTSSTPLISSLPSPIVHSFLEKKEGVIFNQDLTKIPVIGPKEISSTVLNEPIGLTLVIANIETIQPPLLAIADEGIINQYKKTKNKPTLKIGMFGRSESNIITTNTNNIPTDQVISTTIFQRETAGYSGGASIGLAQGRWEFYLKFLYTSINYKPIEVLNVKGSFEKGYHSQKFVDFQFNTFQLPLSVRYNIIDQDQWKLFTSLGVSWHLISNSYYHKKEEQLTDNTGSKPQQNLFNRPIGYKEAQPGFLQEDGKFLSNSYITGNIGFGIERSFSDRWSAFISSRYAHTLHNFNGGIGPYKDNVHTLSFESGIIVTLRR